MYINQSQQRRDLPFAIFPRVPATNTLLLLWTDRFCFVQYCVFALVIVDSWVLLNDSNWKPDVSKQLNQWKLKQFFLPSISDQNTYAFVKQQERSDWRLTMSVKKNTKEKIWKKRRNASRIFIWNLVKHVSKPCYLNVFATYTHLH